MALSRFSGKKVLVMGGGGSAKEYDDIAHATALAFAHEGADIAVVQATEAATEASVREVRKVQNEALSFVLDPFQNDPFDELYRYINESWGGLDILVTSYFGIHFGLASETNIQQFEAIVRQNVAAPFLATKTFTSLMADSSYPSVIHVSSIDGTYGNPNVAAYSISKGATQVLTHVMAAELSKLRIRVNGIARAISSAVSLSPDAFASLADATPMVRPAEPSEYAMPILFLASREASYINGVILPVDGGRTAITPGTSPGYEGYRPYHE